MRRRRSSTCREAPPDGFKILLEILVRTPGLRVGEQPFTFGKRVAGTSKASLGELYRYWKLLLRLRAGSSSPVRAVRTGRAHGPRRQHVALAFFTSRGHALPGGSVGGDAGVDIWNFVLTERWVFPGPAPALALGVRFIAYAAMNNVALLLRGPMLVVLTSWFGINLLLSNVISLCALTVVRYAFADRVIWAPDVRLHHYDVHGLVTLDVAGGPARAGAIRGAGAGGAGPDPDRRRPSHGRAVRRAAHDHRRTGRHHLPRAVRVRRPVPIRRDRPSSRSRDSSAGRRTSCTPTSSSR